MARRVVAGGLVCVALAALLVAGRLVWVHDRTWEWTLRPSATPPKVVVFDRDYRRSDTVDDVVPADAVRVARTPGGGVVLAQQPRPYVPTVVWVRGPGGTRSYALMGGP